MCPTLMGGKKMSAKGVRVEMDGEAIAVNLFIVVRYGSAIGDVAKKVQQMVRTALEGMTGFAGWRRSMSTWAASAFD